MPHILTPLQKKVVGYPYRPDSLLKVIAGPGSGKTEILLRRVHHLISEGHLKADEILILSLTNKAVDNVIDKLKKNVQELNDQVKYSSEELDSLIDKLHIHTIHSIANKIVVEQDGIVNILEENGWRGLMKLISTGSSPTGTASYETNLKKFQQLFKNIYYSTDKVAPKKFEQISSIMKRYKVMTNDEMIIRAARYLETYQNKSKNLEDGCEPQEVDSTIVDIKSKIKVIFIDEYQDLYPSLLPLIKQITIGKQLALFGDPNQSIYQFLGDNVSFLKSLENEYKKRKSDIKTLYMYDNFRNTPEIISQVVEIMGPNLVHYKAEREAQNITLKSSSNLKPIIMNFPNSNATCEFMIDQIIQAVTSSAQLSDIAILARTNSEIQFIANILDKYQIEYQKLTAQPTWLSDPRIQFLIDLWKVIYLVSKEKYSDSEISNEEIQNIQSDFSIIVTLGALQGIRSTFINKLYAECKEFNCSIWNYITSETKSKRLTKITTHKTVKQFIDELSPYINNKEYLYEDNPIKLLKNVCDIAFNLPYTHLQFKDDVDRMSFKNHLEDLFRTMKACMMDRPEDVPLLEWFIETYFEYSIFLHNESNSGYSNSRLTPSSACIKLSTIHSSKGLEFPIVFIFENIFQSFPIENSVLYVAMTRAKNILYMFNVNHPNIKSNFKYPSVFPLAKKKEFWNYYNTTLGRKLTTPNIEKYLLLMQKYQVIRNHQKRWFGTTRIMPSLLRGLKRVPK
ncbi:hypothetical protein TBLA_0B02340 [Henningerozyma blattae CBS 6284]|uniref:DNA 3'-5' helicase n=1 Tax=Henningerozyma blattae (strain ATCC 34711 / CBS 6284 / DSM 70876 / NBRC 10599 / NRRL Y-10934 / UCD 77-7) TaxID=1071380 RepID=I2GY74_HENB6|nr:hypothetical protein TBLA_0B02340 [Tetrapisispora blattae CBS 6284]CCH59076.1 hypothetical protein TBLA_0B02340 [Tetrapisispora blattae CBS 6284]